MLETTGYILCILCRVLHIMQYLLGSTRHTVYIYITGFIGTYIYTLLYRIYIYIYATSSNIPVHDVVLCGILHIYIYIYICVVENKLNYLQLSLHICLSYNIFRRMRVL